jgi:predicted aspartyl protease
MKARYSRAFLPPAPMLPVVVAVPGGMEQRRLQGKVDSGADVCAVPEDLIAELDLPPVRLVRAAGFGGLLQEVTLYHLALEVGGRRYDHVEALGTRRSYAIIGRNVLKDLVVRLDGPKSLLTVTLPRVRSKHRPKI